MNFPKRHFLSVIALLSLKIAAEQSVSTLPTAGLHDPPFWQFILREYVFKMVAASGYQDDDLHKKLLNAPFYHDSLPVDSNDVNTVTSRGKVYNTPDGQWIFCQDGCTKCEPCDWQKDDPLVKWTLRRVKRLTSSGSPKSGLRLTVEPLTDVSFHMSKDSRRENDYHVMHEDTTAAESSDSFQKTDEANFGDSNEAKLHSGSGWSDESSGDDHPRNSQGHTYRSLNRSPLTYYDVDQNINEDKNTFKSLQDDKIPRLIVGIDQDGNKHLVHLIPVDTLVNSPDKSNDYPTNNQRSYQRINAPRIARKIQRESDEAPYEKLIVKILESFDNHRNFIEKFLFSDRIDSVKHDEDAVPSYLGYAADGDEKFVGGSLESYRFDDYRPVNQYSGVSVAEYQNEEQVEQLRRYPVMSREVNKPYGDYQDQNSMIEYVPYGMSPQDEQQQQQQQQQHQLDRSLPLAKAHRKSRNSFGKLMDPTFGHQAISQNQTNASEIELETKRDFLQNSANQALVNLAVKSNGTDAGIRKLPEADFEMQTFASDD